MTSILSVLLSVLSVIGTPIGRAIGYALLAVSLVGGVYVKGRYDEHKVMYRHEQTVLAQQKKEADDAIAAANAARDTAQKKFDNGKFNNRPGRLPGRVRHGSDGYARD